MRRPAPTICPACNGSLHVVRLACEACGTAVEGDFDGGRLARLSREQLAFVHVFLESRGKIKDVEERLGLSYPTVVSRLEQVVQALRGEVELPAPKKGPAPDNRATEEVLASLARGEMTTEQAAARLRGNKKSDGGR